MFSDEDKRRILAEARANIEERAERKADLARRRERELLNPSRGWRRPEPEPERLSRPHPLTDAERAQVRQLRADLDALRSEVGTMREDLRRERIATLEGIGEKIGDLLDETEARLTTKMRETLQTLQKGRDLDCTSPADLPNPLQRRVN